jgi:hypothetical protein
MDPHREKRFKHRPDVIDPSSSKRGRSGKALAGRHPPPHPSHSSDEDAYDREVLEQHSPIEWSSHMALCYSKKMKQSTINDNREALVYEGSKQSRDPRFWALFHSDWYRSIYLHKLKLVVESQWVNWDRMATRRLSTFDKIKATCDELEMTKMMCFKYSWN